jgi:hypothetical protein
VSRRERESARALSEACFVPITNVKVVIVSVLS